MANKELCARFELTDGQFYADYQYKNLWWHLNGVEFGYGDLNQKDLNNIQLALREGEVFEGFNEHHGTEWQQIHDLRVTLRAQY